MMDMETNDLARVVPADVLADHEAICRQAAAGGPKDPELVRRIQERSRQARAEILAKFGVQEIGVQIIREMRDGADA
jgi:hypothetical protein